MQTTENYSNKTEKEFESIPMVKASVKIKFSNIIKTINNVRKRYFHKKT